MIEVQVGHFAPDAAASEGRLLCVLPLPALTAGKRQADCLRLQDRAGDIASVLLQMLPAMTDVPAKKPKSLHKTYNQTAYLAAAVCS